MRSVLVALSAPSGAGKSTICQMLVERNPDFVISVSATTRKKRPNEIDGVHYYFLEKPEFERLIQENAFLEYEEVHGNYYGTLREKLDELRAAGKTVLFDIDVNGALNIKKADPRALLIFIKPPSLEELRRRLQARGTDSPAEIEKRLTRLELEYQKSEFFDKIVINDDLETAVLEVENLIRTHQKESADVSD
ncbi:MAG: guanylate kinase [Calditrichia bacterium]